MLAGFSSSLAYFSAVFSTLLLTAFLTTFLKVALDGVLADVLNVAFDGVLAAFLLSSLQLSLSLLLDEACIVKMSVNVYSA